VNKEQADEDEEDDDCAGVLNACVAVLCMLYIPDYSLIALYTCTDTLT